MSEYGIACFETAIGPCGIAWSGQGILGIQLPEGDAHATRARLLKRFPQAHDLPPTSAAQHAIDGILALLRGEAADLSAVRLDMHAIPPFQRRVYETARSIPPGATLTYGGIAARLGDSTLARAVGQALGRNPFPIIVPCHRVLAAGGRIGGFSATGGITTKRRLLALEKEALEPQAPTLFDA